MRARAKGFFEMFGEVLAKKIQHSRSSLLACMRCTLSSLLRSSLVFLREARSPVTIMTYIVNLDFAVTVTYLYKKSYGNLDSFTMSKYLYAN